MMQEVAEGKALLVCRTKTKPAVKLPAGDEDKPPRAVECRYQGREIGIAINQERCALGRRDAPAVFAFDTNLRCFHGPQVGFPLSGPVLTLRNWRPSVRFRGIRRARPMT